MWTPSESFNLTSDTLQGTELVVTGMTMPEQGGGIRANITGQGRNGEFFMGVSDWNMVAPPDDHLLDHLHLAPTPRNFIKRLWAFLRIKVRNLVFQRHSMHTLSFFLLKHWLSYTGCWRLNSCYSLQNITVFIKNLALLYIFHSCF